MPSDIKVGDLVMVVSGVKCCGAYSGKEGSVFTTTKFYPADHGDYCLKCGIRFPEDCWFGHSSGYAIAEARLKKINPPTADDEVIRERSLENV